MGFRWSTRCQNRRPAETVCLIIEVLCAVVSCIEQLILWPRLQRPSADRSHEGSDRWCARGSRTQRAQRPLNVPRLLWDAFGWEGNILPPQVRIQTRLQGAGSARQGLPMVRPNDDADKIKMDSSLAHIPVVLGHDIWRACDHSVYGCVHMFGLHPRLRHRGNPDRVVMAGRRLQLVSAVEGRPQELSTRLNDAELEWYAKLTQ